MSHTDEIKAIQADMIRLTIAVDEFTESYKEHKETSLGAIGRFDELITNIQTENILKGVKLAGKVDKVFCEEGKGYLRSLSKYAVINILATLLLTVMFGVHLYTERDHDGRIRTGNDRSVTEEGRVSGDSGSVDLGARHKQRDFLYAKAESQSR